MQRIMWAQQWVFFLYKGDDALQKRIKSKNGDQRVSSCVIICYCWISGPKYFRYLQLLVLFNILYWQLSQGNILETFTILHLASNIVLAQESSVVLETALIPLVMRRQLNNKQQNNKINQKIINMIQECAFIHGKGRNQLTINLIFLCFPRAKPRLNL